MSNLPHTQAAIQRIADRQLARQAQQLRGIIVRQLSQPGTQVAALRRTYRNISHRQAQALGLRGRSMQTANGNIRTRVRSGYREIKVSAPGDSPAVQTGRLRQSITVQKVKAGRYRVGTNVEYAPYLEFGTRNMQPRPFMRPALEKHRHEP
ncbi:HK97-gp10 family putative phage morphogenesis protein [Deinococcus lacus]|uniref:HK97-gp10 family putative phage morphogenesis protein n=1 Tax=Deinococcus lacus TaxID=392561 RepID=A0ABW1YBK0_9DEIO